VSVDVCDCCCAQVNAKYKARAKHFQCKAQLMEQCNTQLQRELASAHHAVQHYQTTSQSSSNSSSPGSAVAAAGPLPRAAAAASPSLTAAGVESAAQ